MLQKIIIFFVYGLFARAQNSAIIDNQEYYELSEFIKPIQYNLLIVPYPDEDIEKNFKFDGYVEIVLVIEEKVPSIILHSKDLKFDSTNCSLYRSTGEFIKINEITFDDKTELVYISRADNEKFANEQYNLTIHYMGEITNKQHGFFKFTYVNAEGVKGWSASTYFEPNYARRAFPCFDEPKYRAKFNITIVHDKEHTVFSNMPHKRSYSVDSKIKTVFELSPPMSTYLVAFLIIPHVETITMSYYDYNITVIDPKSISNADFIIKTSELTLKAMKKFTGIVYNLPKLAYFGLPNYIAVGMENWGLIIHRYSKLYSIVNDVTQRTVTHETIHHWLGNAVTLKSWDDLWLKDGITGYFTYYIIDKIDPSSVLYNYFVANRISTVMSLDSRSDSVALHPNTVTLESIRYKLFGSDFNFITFKGAALTRMLHHIVSEKIFQDCMNKYIREFYFRNANSDDFYEAFQQVLDRYKTGISVKIVMNSWVNFPGYPVVDVIRDYNSKIINISQKRFIQDKTFNDSNHIYAIPINFATKTKPDFEDTRPKYWLWQSSEEIGIDVKSEDWIILNKQLTGYYRVNYDVQNWNLIINYLNFCNFTNIHVFNRVQLISDAFEFFKQEQLGTRLFLKLIYYLRRETDNGVWSLAFEVISWLDNKFINSVHYPLFRTFMQSILKPLFDSIGFKTSKIDHSMYWTVSYNARYWSCYFNVSSCIEESRNELSKFLFASAGSDSDTLNNGIRTADIHTWEVLHKNMSEKGRSSEEKDMFQEVLRHSNDKNIMRTYIKTFINLNDADLIELYKLIETITKPTTRNLDAFIDYLVEEVFPSHIEYDVMSEILDKISDVITSDQLSKLKSSNYPNELNKTMNQIESKVSMNIDWLCKRTYVHKTLKRLLAGNEKWNKEKYCN